MMEQMFQNDSYSFYRFGDFFYLNKISEKDWVEYICQRFESTGKHISEALACKICQVTDWYSSYVQQLAWFVWLRVQDNSVVTEEDLKSGVYPAFSVLLFRNMMQDYKKNGVLFVYIRNLGYFCKRVSVSWDRIESDIGYIW